MITPSIPQFFLPQRGIPTGAATLVYEPRCLGIAKLYYVDAKAGLSVEQDVAVAGGHRPSWPGPLWDEAVPAEVRDKDLETVPEPGALFGPGSAPRWGTRRATWRGARTSRNGCSAARR